MAGNGTLIVDTEIWQTSGMIVPAIMTLICFVCTAVSLTVSGFICLRDREAQDETDNKAKHHSEQEFVSKVLGLFYKIRTSNIFRIKEIMQDLNDERPVWIGSKKEIITNLEYYGILLTETEQSKLMTTDEVFEIDCESLFYFELERFSKAQAIYGSNVLNYFQSIQQDGAAFPREFYPDIKNIFHIDIIYNVFTEMQIITELFVLLATGIDLEIISVYAIPPQFRHSQLGNELDKIKDFLYNYYKRVFPTQRSTANVMRSLPQLPIVYEQILSDITPDTIETIVEVIEDIEEEPGELRPQDKQSLYGSETSLATEYTPREQQMHEPSILGSPAPTPQKTPRSSTTHTGAQSRGRRLSASLGKQKVKIAKAYQKLSDRVKQRPYSQDDETSIIDPDEFREPKRKQGGVAIIREAEEEDEPTSSKQVKFEDSQRLPTPVPVEAAKKTVKRTVTKRVPVVSDPEQTQEKILDRMRTRYKAPVKRESSTRRRGMLSTQQVLEHNAFTYMVTRVLAFLQDKGHLTDEELTNVPYNAVDRNFII